MEMSRQRLRRSLGESANQVCPRCNGAGVVRSVESLALAILRLLGEEARKDRTSKVISELPIDVATFLLNEKREWIHRIETSTDVELLLVANASLETPNYTIRRVRDDQTLLPENTGSSYDLITPEGNALEDALKLSTKTHAEDPAVSVVTPDTPAPAPKKRQPEKQQQSSGGIVGFFRKLFGNGKAEAPKSEKTASSNRNQRGKKSASRRSGGSGGRNENRRRGSQGERNKQNERRSSGGKGQQAGQKRNPNQQDTDQNRKQGAAGESGENTSGRKRRRRRRSSGRNRSEENTNQQAQDINADTAENGSATANTPAPQSDKSTAREQGQQATRDTAPAIKPAAPGKKISGNSGAESKEPENKGPENNSADNKSPQNQGAGKPQADGQQSGNKKSDSGNSANGAAAPEKDRLLPWESSAGETKSSYKVWSSDDE
jgi:ribonuclease E